VRMRCGSGKMPFLEIVSVQLVYTKKGSPITAVSFFLRTAKTPSREPETCDASYRSKVVCG